MPTPKGIAPQIPQLMEGGMGVTVNNTSSSSMTSLGEICGFCNDRKENCATATGVTAEGIIHARKKLEDALCTDPGEQAMRMRLRV